MTKTKKSIVFCHGIWADGSCFNKVIPTLQSEGYEVMSAQYGLDTNENDVAAVKRTLGRVRNPAILVGHSYGGSVITAAGVDERVTGLVYIAALAPDAGETSESFLDKFPTSDIFSHIEVADGRVWMKPEGVKAFAGDLPEEEQKLVWATNFAPAAEFVHQECAWHRLEIKTELVHRGNKGPHRPTRVATLCRKTHGCHDTGGRKQSRRDAL